MNYLLLTIIGRNELETYYKICLITLKCTDNVDFELISERGGCRGILGPYVPIEKPRCKLNRGCSVNAMRINIVHRTPRMPPAHQDPFRRAQKLPARGARNVRLENGTP